MDYLGTARSSFVSKELLGSLYAQDHQKQYQSAEHQLTSACILGSFLRILTDIHWTRNVNTQHMICNQHIFL